VARIAIRRSLDTIKEYYDPRQAATNTLIALVKYRTRDTIQMVMHAIDSVFATYVTVCLIALFPCGPLLNAYWRVLNHDISMDRYQQSPPDQRNHILKEGAMRTFGSLSKLLMSKSDYINEMVSRISNHIFPEMKSPIGFLRARVRMQSSSCVARRGVSYWLLFDNMLLQCCS